MKKKINISTRLVVSAAVASGILVGYGGSKTYGGSCALTGSADTYTCVLRR